MTTFGNAGRVGLVFLIFLGLFIGMFFFLGKLSSGRTYSFDVLFDDAQGVTADTPVTIAGVQIGKVSQVKLTGGQKADLTLQIRKEMNGRPVVIPKGSRFTIVTPLLGQTGTIVVVPPKNAASLPPIRDGETDLTGERTGDFTSSFNKVNGLLDQTKVTAKKVDALLDNANRLATDPTIQGSLRQTLGNVNAASRNGLLLTNKLNDLLLEDNAQVKVLLRQTQAGAQVSLNDINATTASIRDTTRENRKEINAIVRNLNDTTSAVAGITGQTNNALKNGGITQNLEASVANLKATSDKLNAITANFQSASTLAADPKVQADLRETLSNIKQSSAATTLLLERLGKIAGVKKPAAPAVIVPGGPTVIVPGAGGASAPPATPARGAPYYLPRAQALYNTRDKHFRIDLDAVYPLSIDPVTFARAGVYGFGDSNKLILQAGRGLGTDGLVDVRGGLYASKLALGADIGLGRRETLSLDLYDPNFARIDAKGTLMLTPEIGLVAGGENLNRRAGGLIGLEYRRSK